MPEGPEIFLAARAVHAYSKAMLTEFANVVVLSSHNQLYGEWVVHKAGEPLLAKQIRLVITTQYHQTVLYCAQIFCWLRVFTRFAKLACCHLPSCCASAS